MEIKVNQIDSNTIDIRVPFHYTSYFTSSPSSNSSHVMSTTLDSGSTEAAINNRFSLDEPGKSTTSFPGMTFATKNL